MLIEVVAVIVLSVLTLISFLWGIKMGIEYEFNSTNYLLKKKKKKLNLCLVNKIVPKFALFVYLFIICLFGRPGGLECKAMECIC